MARCEAHPATVLGVLGVLLVLVRPPENEILAGGPPAPSGIPDGVPVASNAVAWKAAVPVSACASSGRGTRPACPSASVASLPPTSAPARLPPATRHARAREHIFAPAKWPPQGARRGREDEMPNKTRGLRLSGTPKTAKNIFQISKNSSTPLRVLCRYDIVLGSKDRIRSLIGLVKV